MADPAPRPVVAIFDLDRTITRHGTYTPFLLSVAGRNPGRLWGLIRALPIAAGYLLGLVSRKFLKEAMLRAVLDDKSKTNINAHVTMFVDKLIASGLRSGASAALGAHVRKGDELMVATAAFDVYVDEICRRLGINHIVCTHAERDTDGWLSGQIVGENCYGSAKLEAVERALPGRRGECDIIVYSDHHSDLPLMRWADRAVAVNPSSKLREAARAEGFEVVDWNIA